MGSLVLRKISTEEDVKMTRCDIIGGISFLLALGIVGGVEHGAPLRNMVAAFVFVGIFGVCVLLGNRRHA